MVPELPDSQMNLQDVNGFAVARSVYLSGYDANPCRRCPNPIGKPNILDRLFATVVPVKQALAVERNLRNFS